MLQASTKKLFDEKGFVLVHDLISKADVKRIRDRYELLFAGTFDTGM